MCADLVDVHWRDSAGKRQKTIANLEDISESGICLQMDTEIPLNAILTVSCPKGDYVGQVRYCVYRDIGHFVGIQFEPGSKWTKHEFKPRHLFDPQSLMHSSNATER